MRLGTFGVWDIGTFGLWDSGTFGLLDIGTFGLWDFGILDFGTLGLVDFWTLGLLDFWTLEFWAWHFLTTQKAKGNVLTIENIALLCIHCIAFFDNLECPGNFVTTKNAETFSTIKNAEGNF